MKNNENNALVYFLFDKDYVKEFSLIEKRFENELNYLKLYFYPTNDIKEIENNSCKKIILTKKMMIEPYLDKLLATDLVEKIFIVSKNEKNRIKNIECFSKIFE